MNNIEIQRVFHIIYTHTIWCKSQVDVKNNARLSQFTWNLLCSKTIPWDSLRFAFLFFCGASGTVLHFLKDLIDTQDRRETHSQSSCSGVDVNWTSWMMWLGVDWGTLSKTNIAEKNGAWETIQQTLLGPTALFVIFLVAGILGRRGNWECISSEWNLERSFQISSNVACIYI